eukprot:CFRG6524T1
MSSTPKMKSKGGGYNMLWFLLAGAMAVTATLIAVSLVIWNGSQGVEPRSFDEIIQSLGDSLGGSEGMDVPAMVDEFLTPEFLGNMSSNLVNDMSPETRQVFIKTVVEVLGETADNMPNSTMYVLGQDVGIVLAEMLNNSTDTSGQSMADGLQYLQFPINGLAEGFNTTDIANQMVANSVFLVTTQMPTDEIAIAIASLMDIVLPIAGPIVKLYENDTAAVDKLMGDVGLGFGLYMSQSLNKMNSADAVDAVESAYESIAGPMWALYDAFNVTDSTLTNIGLAMGNISFDAFSGISSENGAQAMINSVSFLSGMSDSLLPQWQNITIGPMGYLKEVTQDDFNLVMSRLGDDVVFNSIAAIVPGMITNLTTAGKTLQAMKWMIVNQTMAERSGWDLMSDMLGNAAINADAQKDAESAAAQADNNGTSLVRRGLLESLSGKAGMCMSYSLNEMNADEMVDSFWVGYDFVDDFIWGVWDGLNLTDASRENVGLALGKIMGEGAGSINLTTAVPTLLRGKYFIPGLADGMEATSSSFNEIARLVVAFLTEGSQNVITSVLDGAINGLLLNFANTIIPTIETDISILNKTNDGLTYMVYSMTTTQRNLGWDLLKPTLLSSRSQADTYLKENNMPPYDT